jgi:hypothetical protein
MKRMVMLVIAVVALGVLAAAPAAAQVRVSGYIVVGSPAVFGPRPLLVEVVPPYGYYRPHESHRWYRAYRPVVGVERVRVYRPQRRAWRREGRGRGW